MAISDHIAPLESWRDSDAPDILYVLKKFFSPNGPIEFESEKEFLSSELIELSRQEVDCIEVKSQLFDALSRNKTPRVRFVFARCFRYSSDIKAFAFFLRHVPELLNSGLSDTSVGLLLNEVAMVEYSKLPFAGRLDDDGRGDAALLALKIWEFQNVGDYESWFRSTRKYLINRIGELA